jgi:hypothetical protein
MLFTNAHCQSPVCGPSRESMMSSLDPSKTGIYFLGPGLKDSPSFLYLDEPNDKQGPRQLTDRELAIRLAYFLWSAPPDQRLLELAQSKQLMSFV